MNNQNKPYVKKWLGFNARMDLIHDCPKKSIRKSVTAVRDWALTSGFSVTLDEAAHELYVQKSAYEAHYGVRAGSKPVTESGQRFYVMVSVPQMLVLTYTFKRVKWEVEQMLLNGVQVMVYSPYKVPSKYLLKNVAEWNDLCDKEANPEWAKWMKELDINLDVVLDEATPWLSFDSLRHLMNQFSGFNLFMDYINAEIAEIESQGVWDVDCAGSEVFNEKASVWNTFNHGKVNKGCEYKYATKKRFWYNYEQLPVDILTKYLHLTYLDSIDYKPMQRITCDGVEYGTKAYFEFLNEQDIEDGQYEQGLTVSPMYVDPYADKSNFECDKIWVSPYKLASDLASAFEIALTNIVAGHIKFDSIQKISE